MYIKVIAQETGELYYFIPYGMSAIVPSKPHEKRFARIVLTDGRVFAVSNTIGNILDQLEAVANGDYSVEPDTYSNDVSELLATDEATVIDDGDTEVPSDVDPDSVSVSVSGGLRPLPEEVRQQIFNESL